jgi:hypothetical protein
MMIRQQSVPDLFAFQLVREFLISDDDQFEELEPIGDKEFYSVLAMLIAGVVLLALTIGPIAII